MPGQRVGTGPAAAAGIERVEPAQLVSGGDSLLFVSGWSEGGAAVDLLFDGRPAGAAFYPLPRAADSRTADPASERFAAILPIRSTYPAGEHGLAIRTRRGAMTLDTNDLARVTLLGSSLEIAPIPLPQEPAGEPSIAICLATYEPAQTLFERQVESIREQSHRRFICIVYDDGSTTESWESIQDAVRDDPRFVCFRGDRRLGYYRNFERALRLVPREVTFVALSDQDDRWYPEKLETLAAALQRSGAQLACSDMRIVDGEGRVLAPSYWRERRPNFTRLGSLLLMNTVTGASALFRRELLDEILPFPPEVGRLFHDHWIASVALASGEIEYVARPLHDYVQHGSNVAGSHVASDDFRGGALHALKRLATEPRRRLASTRARASTQYTDELFRVALFARTLELRLGPRLAPGRANELRRLARLGRTTESLLWLVARSIRDVSGRGETLGAENQLLKAVVWKHHETLRRRFRVARRAAARVVTPRSGRF